MNLEKMNKKICDCDNVDRIWEESVFGGDFHINLYRIKFCPTCGVLLDKNGCVEYEIP